MVDITYSKKIEKQTLKETANKKFLIQRLRNVLWKSRFPFNPFTRRIPKASNINSVEILQTIHRAETNLKTKIKNF